jgi:hypothetical protein
VAGDIDGETVVDPEEAQVADNDSAPSGSDEATPREEQEKTTFVKAPPVALTRAKLLPTSKTSTPGAQDVSKQPKTTVQKEHTEVGRVQWRVYTAYIKAASRVGFLVFIVLLLAAQAASIGASITLMKWGNDGPAANVGRYIAIYGLCVGFSALANVVSSLVLWVLCSLRSAGELHDGMLAAVMRAPMSFFETTPTGRLVARVQ